MPTRDGEYLRTLIYFPHAEISNPEGKFPAVVDRSPYGYGDLEWIVDIFLPFGFVAIGQDMRGTEKSTGNFSMWFSDANDRCKYIQNHLATFG
jgi:predicted acyl esterase